MREIASILRKALVRNAVILRIAVALGLFTLLLRRIEGTQIIRAFADADPAALILACILMVPNLAIQVLKWRYLLRAAGIHATIASATTSVLGGMFLGAATPARTGELGRGIFMNGRPVLPVAALTAVDKGYNQVVVLSVGIAGCAAWFGPPWSMVLAVAAVFPAAALLAVHRLEPLIRRLVHRFTRTDTPDRILAVVDTLSQRTIAVMFLFGVVFYAVYAAQFFLFLRAFTGIDMATAARTIPVVYLVDLLLPVSVGAFGVKETAAVELLGRAGLEAAPVFAATVLQNAITFLVPALAGGVLTMIGRPRSPRQDRP